MLLVVLALAWELYARALDNPLLFPTFSATVAALVRGVASGAIPRAGAYTLSLLLKGYIVGARDRGAADGVRERLAASARTCSRR